ncbi:JAB-like toxin 1 domain-containing protein [uncultured Coprobacter sp.]|uniref:JAB-like toxin 1 domain-containing protein n=1 Tax=uncultured Coprobacter sp. TaxID=1720550 RepID=UPI0026292F00|nr:JAB-like toxin 1 domain-containing protein [uncultured Coprobacter sp.]
MNEKIYYNEDLPEGVEPLYNGNIADVYYSAHDSAHFRLSYDGLNRLTASQQYTRDGVKTAAAEAFTYDKMGNITSIVRSTEKPIPNYINRVQLFYDGNRIIRGEGSPYSGGYNDMVYPNLVGKDVEYEYDPNGNLIKNSDNRISLTIYNLLNLPQTVAFSDKSLSVFYYMADGRKIRNASGAYSISTAVPIDSVVKNTDPYISYMSEWNDMYWYQRTQQKYINTPEGNIEVSTGRKMSYSYYYTSKDHLGSIWQYWNSLSSKYSNVFYPSGIMREKRRSPYNYGLTGKEIVYDNGLDEYFFGARTLFAPINRFNQPDPLCEEYYHISPYAYCGNNFINAVDPDGRDIWEINNKGRVVNHVETTEHDAFYMVDKKGIRIKGKELIFKYGTVESFKSQYFDKEKNLSFDYYNVKGDNNGKQLFEFFATNSSVEWSQLLLGKNETNGLNIISTSHMNDTEKGIIFLYNKQYKYGYTIRGHIHNHFQNKNPSSNDVENAKIISQNHQKLGRKIPFFKIFMSKTKEYTNYNRNSVPAESLQKK